MNNPPEPRWAGDACTCVGKPQWCQSCLDGMRMVVKRAHDAAFQAQEITMIHGAKRMELMQENAALTTRIAELEADNARLIGIVENQSGHHCELVAKYEALLASVPRETSEAFPTTALAHGWATKGSSPR